jgi:hypothetical protein
VVGVGSVRRWLEAQRGTAGEGKREGGENKHDVPPSAVFIPADHIHILGIRQQLRRVASSAGGSARRQRWKILIGGTRRGPGAAATMPVANLLSAEADEDDDIRQEDDAQQSHTPHHILRHDSCSLLRDLTVLLFITLDDT